MIWPNGAGKSNFVEFFRLLREMIDGRLQLALAATEGGADGCLYLGPKITKEFVAELHFGDDGFVYESLSLQHPTTGWSFRGKRSLAK